MSKIKDKIAYFVLSGSLTLLVGIYQLIIEITRISLGQHDRAVFSAFFAVSYFLFAIYLAKTYERRVSTND